MKAKVIFNGVEKEVEMTQTELEKMGYEFPKFTNYAHRPRVKVNYKYWFISYDGEIEHYYENNDTEDEALYLLGNYFYTEAEAIAKRDKILAKQKQYDMYDKEIFKKGGK